MHLDNTAVLEEGSKQQMEHGCHVFTLPRDAGVCKKLKKFHISLTVADYFGHVTQLLENCVSLENPYADSN